MTDLFLEILNLSISAGWLVLAALVLRLLLKKAPKWVNVLLWAIVAVRLVLPVTLESEISLIPSSQTVSPEIMMTPKPTIDTGIPVINDAVNPVISQSFAPQPLASANPLQILLPVVTNLWLLGIVLMLLYTLITYLRLRIKVRTAVRVGDNIYQTEKIASPFVLGIIKPRIYLPFTMDAQDMDYVIAHETAHIRRKDHWWKPLGFLVLSVYWFNPLLWVGYVLLCRDIELACDEKVVKKLEIEQRADYSQALLNSSVNRKTIAACPLAFGEVGIKMRVKAVLRYKKPIFLIILSAVILSAAVAACFLTDPVGSNTVLYVKIVDSWGKFVSEPRWMLYGVNKLETACLPGWNSLELTNMGLSKGKIKIALSEEVYLDDALVSEITVSKDSPVVLRKTYESFSVSNGIVYDDTRHTHYSFYIGNKRDIIRQGSVKEWFDDSQEAYENREISVPQIPGAIFRYNNNSTIDIIDQADCVRTIGDGFDDWIENAFFSDLTGDGIPELCMTTQWGGDNRTYRIDVVDYKNGQMYTMNGLHRGGYTLVSKGGMMFVDAYGREYMQGLLRMIKDPETGEMALAFLLYS